MTAVKRGNSATKGEKLMIRRKIGHLMVASAFVLALTGAGATSAFAFHTENPTPGSDLAADVQAGEAGEKANVTDESSSAEFNVDDGAVEDVDAATVTSNS
jgi:hypothetical protein